jgi:chromosome segregation ATPase
MGYVYVISNIGAFGENVYKIGMTRRLEPMDRVRELGDASVPFPFDVHAIIFSQDAPNMEYQLHQVFDSERLNMINCRREFFKVPLSKIKEEAEKLGARVEFTMLAEAREYRESERIRKEGSLSIQHKTDELLSKVLDVYPEEI